MPSPSPIDTQSSRVLASSARVNTNANMIKINESKIEHFLRERGADVLKHRSKKASVAFPLRFSSDLVEINFVCLWAALRFGLGFDDVLKRHTGKSADDVMLFGLLSLFMGDNNLDTPGLLSLNINSVASAFNLPINKEVQIMTGVYTDKPTPVHPVAVAINTCLHDTAERLQACGASSLGHFVVQTCQSSSIPDGMGKTGPSAQKLAAALAAAFPVFDDTAQWGVGYSSAKVEVVADDADYDTVVIKASMYSKVQWLCLELFHRFGKTDPKCFEFVDIDSVTISAAPTVALSLIDLGIIEGYSEGIDALTTIENKTVMSADDAIVVELRAASVCAVETIAKKTNIPRYEVAHFLSEMHRKCGGSFKINSIVCRDTFAW